MIYDSRLVCIGTEANGIKATWGMANVFKDRPVLGYLGLSHLMRRKIVNSSVWSIVRLAPGMVVNERLVDESINPFCP